MSDSNSAVDPYASPNEAPVSDNTARKPFFARANTIAAAVCIGLTIFMLQPFVGITYRKYYDNEPLQNPVRVVRRGESELELADGRVVTELYSTYRLDWTFKHVDQLIEVQPIAGRAGEVEVFVKEFNFICGIGDPWYTIPLVPNRVRRYNRVFVDAGRCAPAIELADK